FAVGGVGSRSRERAPARSDNSSGVDERDCTDLRQRLEVRQKAMQSVVAFDAIPVEAADAIVDPGEYQRIGLERAERMFVQLAGIDIDPLPGLELDKPEILPGGAREEQQRYGRRG